MLGIQIIGLLSMGKADGPLLEQISEQLHYRIIMALIEHTYSKCLQVHKIECLTNSMQGLELVKQ